MVSFVLFWEHLLPGHLLKCLLSCHECRTEQVKGIQKSSPYAKQMSRDLAFVHFCQRAETEQQTVRDLKHLALFWFLIPLSLFCCG